MTDHGLSTIEPDEATRLLGAGVVGRLAFLDEHGTLQLLPVNYRTLDGDVFLLTEPHGLVAQAVGSPQVVFQVDHHDDTFQNGWSIVVRGAAEVVEDDALRERALEAGLRAWAEGDRSTLVRIAAQQTTGRRVRLAPS